METIGWLSVLYVGVFVGLIVGAFSGYRFAKWERPAAVPEASPADPKVIPIRRFDDSSWMNAN